MADNIRNVAVVGAGISGVCAAAHLLRQGLFATVYERMSVAGGVWHFDERVAHEQRYPNEIPSLGDYERVKFEDQDVYETPPRTPPEQRLDLDSEETLDQQVDIGLKDAVYMSIAHSSPGPCYVNLKNNVSLPAMKTSLSDWPEGLEDFVNQRYLEQYIQKIARDHDVQQATQYNTRVEDIRKVGNKWRVCTTSLVLPEQISPDDSVRFTTPPRLRKSVAFFDAVVVASGHYHMPRIPNIPGLVDARNKSSQQISHSKGYRNAEKYRNSNVLIIGAGVSSLDIAKEIVLVGGTVYQSSRGGQFDLPAKMLPKGAHRVAGVGSFIVNTSATDTDIKTSSHEDRNANLPLEQTTPLPLTVQLTDNTTLTSIHHIILATGYMTSYPFLPTKHSDHLSRHQADKSVLVTREGDMVHNLHKDIFYIEDPTLSFVGVPYHISTFSLFDFQAQTIARVYSANNSAKLPSREDMRSEYEDRMRRVGLGREFHSLRAEDAEIGYVADLVALVNEGLWEGEEAMLGHTEEWHVAHRKQREMLAERLGKEALQRKT